MLAKSSIKETAPVKSAAEVEALVLRIADSETFRAAPVMRTLFLYLWNHRGQPMGEYSIALDALGRSPDFDPKADSTVRVQIARLRNKLKEFYETDPEFPLKLSIPLGRHEIEFAYKLPEPSIWTRLASATRRYRLTAAIAAALLALSAIVFLAIENQRLRAALPAAPPPLPRFWKSFLVGNKPATIVAPNPLYFSWPSHGVVVRDFAISEFPNWRSSPLLNEISQKWGPPQFSQTYIGALEMNTAVKILQYLERSGQQVQLVESRRFPAETFAAHNTIYFGMPRTAMYLDRLVAKTNFYIAQVQPDIVRNRNPISGEPSEYREISYSADRRVHPAIIIMLPVRPEGTRSLLLMGRLLGGITSMLLSSEGLKLLDEQWQNGGSPDGWEMVIHIEIYRDTVLKVVPVAFRSISPSFWR